MKLPEVISMGTLLVEGKRPNRHQPFEQSGTFAGPFPGDAPIYSDALAHLSHVALRQLSSNPLQFEYLAEARPLPLTGCNPAITVSVGKALSLTEVGRLANTTGLLKTVNLFKTNEVG